MDDNLSSLEVKAKICIIFRNEKAKFAHSAKNHGPVTAYWVCVNTSFVASENQTFLTWF